jgi:DNA-binding LytR/AlgR family response regulator
MTTALIAEDEPLLAETLAAELRRAWPALRLLPPAPNGVAAVETCLRERPDIVFLDIRMPGLSGLEAAVQIAEEADPLPLIVFVTAYDEYALAAFEAQAADYLLKPVQPQRLAQTVSRLQARLSAPPALDQLGELLRRLQPMQPRLRHLQAAVGEAVELVPVDALIYLEAADKYVRAVTADKDYWVRVSLRELLPQLDPELFWQVHRGTVVRIDAVARALRLENGTLQLELRGRSEKLAVSRLHAGRFKAL